MTLLPLAANEAHLWRVDPKAITDPEIRQAYWNLMTPQEQEKQQRFYFAKGRQEYLVTRALVRSVLSRYYAAEPAAWRFKENRYGRPEIDTPAQAAHLRFNLSHTDGLIVCLVARELEIGVDVENITRQTRSLEIAESHFSRQEVMDLSALPKERQHNRFFEYWTLKEAYIKARGMGLALPLGQFSFHLEAGCPVRISFGPQIDDDPEAWQFAQRFPTPDHLMAVAIRRGPVQDLTIHEKHGVPLA